jgi:sec-independent protein translocase protein TatA
MGLGSGWHWIIILIIVLLLFGNRLPSMMRSLGRGVTEFKKGLEGGEDEEEPKLKKEKQDKPAEKPAEKSAAEN